MKVWVYMIGLPVGIMRWRGHVHDDWSGPPVRAGVLGDAGRRFRLYLRMIKFSELLLSSKSPAPRLVG